jgi:hypothetical protein
MPHFLSAEKLHTSQIHTSICESWLEEKKWGWNMTKSQCIWTSLSTQILRTTKPVYLLWSWDYWTLIFILDWKHTRWKNIGFFHVTYGGHASWRPASSGLRRACWDKEGGEEVVGMAWRCSPVVDGEGEFRPESATAAASAAWGRGVRARGRVRSVRRRSARR